MTNQNNHSGTYFLLAASNTALLGAILVSVYMYKEIQQLKHVLQEVHSEYERPLLEDKETMIHGYELGFDDEESETGAVDVDNASCVYEESESESELEYTESSLTDSTCVEVETKLKKTFFSRLVNKFVRH